MLTQAILEKKLKELKETSTSVSWAVIDPSCNLSIRFEPKKQSCYFYFRIRSPKQISRCLGSIESISLTEAQCLALQMRVAVQKNDPLPESKTRESTANVVDMSLSQLLFKWRDSELEKSFPRWDPKDSKAQQKFDGIVRNHLTPAFKQRPFATIKAEELEIFLSDLYRAHSSFATSLKPWIRSSYMYAERKELCDNGYAIAQKLELLLKDRRWRHTGARKHHAALPVSEIPEFMNQLHDISGTTARCLEITILTASRVSATTQMRWKDVNLKKGIWRCPKEIMKVKSNGDHIVYLSPQAVSIIKSIKNELTDGCLPNGIKPTYVFSNPTGKPICSSLTKTIQTMNKQRLRNKLQPWIDPEQSNLASHDKVVTAHGFRATFKSWSRSERLGNYQRFEPVAVERCLHHFVKDQYCGAYDREEFPLMQKRIMEEWSKYCYSLSPDMLKKS